MFEPEADAVAADEPVVEDADDGAAVDETPEEDGN